ncbi:type II secretion system F family protein [bacterium]|nr:type II secretion system F family protein [bacterium]NCQ55953.1 type II secretion system F family protein [Candidatus Parcubacteria bacterium]NCS67978.1 type II secretion system F family protein [Candidatus Peregrinibacteria bacterium]NCS96872.1 type II secretion system F family protein [bacterium]
MSDLANPASSFPNPGSNPGGNSAANIPNPFAVASTPPVTPAPVAPMPPVNQSPVTPAAVPPQNPAVVQTAAAAAPQISAPVQTAPTMPVAAPVPPAPAPAAPQTPLPTKVQEKETLVLDIKGQAKKEKAEVEGISFFKQVDEYLINMSGIKLDEKLLFFQLLASMIGAGLPIIDALNLLINQTNNKKLARVITDMRTQIERGESLASAMRNNDDVFDEATCSVVEAGEKSGKLNAILKELVAQYEQISSLTKKIKAVMMYPIIVIVFMLLLTVVVLIFVVPKLEELFGGGENLPLPTRMLINGSDIVLSYWYFLIAGAVGGMFGFLYWKKSKTGSRQWSIIVLRMPIFGDILSKMILTRVSRIFGFLISAGVPVVESLKIASHIAENPIYQDKLLLAADDLTKGISIAENLSDDERLFPSMLVNMMAIGEKTASLDQVMGKAADFYNEELDRKIGGMSKMMEPVILSIIAGGAVFMILAIYLPILQMNDQVVGGF